MFGLLWGFYPAQLLRTLAQLGIPDELAAGPRDVATLADRTGTHPPSLHRLLTAAVGLRLLARTGDGRVALAPAGQLLRSGVPGSMGNLAQLFCGDATWRSWGELAWSVQTGTPAFEKVTGRDAFSHLTADPELSAVFTEAMAEGTRAPGDRGRLRPRRCRLPVRRRRRERDAAVGVPGRAPGPARYRRRTR